MGDAKTSLSVSIREKDMRNMEPLLKSAANRPTWSWHHIRQPHIREYEAGESGANFTSVSNSAAGYPTSYRIHRDQNFMGEFCVKLFKSRRILIHHCISEYGETPNSKQKKWGNVCIFVCQGIRLAPVPCKTQENLQDLRSKTQLFKRWVMW